MALDQIAHAPDAAVRLTALGHRNEEGIQASKLLVLAFAIISHSGCGVKPEKQLGR